MAPPVTEFALLPMKPGEHPDDAASHTGKVFRGLVAQLLEQPGTQRCYWGREVEHPDMLRFFVDWDSLAHHQQFMDSPQYESFFDGWLSIMSDAPPVLYHSAMEPHPPTAALSKASSPVTEILTVYFPLDYSAQSRKDFETNMAKLEEAVKEHADGYKAGAMGWVIEDVAIPGAEEGTEKARVYVAFLGWESVAAHRAFQQTQAFKDVIGLLREAKHKRHHTAVHISGNVISKGD